MLRITTHYINSSSVELKLAGRIETEEAALLEGELRRLLRDGTLSLLDLEDIQFINRVGLDLLKRWVDKGLQLRGGSAFIQRMLAANGLEGGAQAHR